MVVILFSAGAGNATSHSANSARKDVAGCPLTLTDFTPRLSLVVPRTIRLPSCNGPTNVMTVIGGASSLSFAASGYWLSSAGLPLELCLVVLMAAPLVTVLGYENVGHRHLDGALNGRSCRLRVRTDQTSDPGASTEG